MIFIWGEPFFCGVVKKKEKRGFGGIMFMVLKPNMYWCFRLWWGGGGGRGHTDTLMDIAT